MSEKNGQVARVNWKLTRKCSAALMEAPAETLRSFLGKREAREAERDGLEARAMFRLSRVRSEPKALAKFARVLKPVMEMQEKRT